MVSSHSHPLLKGLRSGPRHLQLRDVVASAAAYKGFGRKVDAVKLQLFGYAKGFPGESAWLKPLEGRELMNWHWPSKHKIPSFHVDQYFAMQALRHKPRGTHLSFLGLGRLLNLLVSKQHQIRSLLSGIGEKEFSEHPTLQDMYSVYRTLFTDEPLRFPVLTSYWRKNDFQWSRSISPIMMLALLEEVSRRTDKASDSLRTINGARETKYVMRIVEISLKELKEFLQRRLRDPDAYEVAEKLLYLSTSSWLPVPSPCCSYQGLRPGDQEFKPPFVGDVDADEAYLPSDQWRKERHRARQSLLAVSASGSVKSYMKSSSDSSSSAKQYDGSGDIHYLGLRSGSKKRRPDAKAGQLKGGQEAVEDGKTGLLRNLLRVPSVDYFPICLDGSQRPGTEHIVDGSQAHREQMVHALTSDEALRTLYSTRIRFQDPLFRRKRLSFLDRLARSRVKSPTAREMGSKMYALHPDKQETFPVNKGLANREWPSPYH